MAESYNLTKLAADVTEIVQREFNPEEKTVVKYVDPLKYDNEV